MAKQYQHKDLMDYLRQEFMTWKGVDSQPYTEDNGGIVDPMAEIDEFIKFCRARLHANQVTGVEHIGQGLSLRLQDSTVVPVIPEETIRVMDGISGFHSVNEGKTGKGIDPSQSWGITK